MNVSELARCDGISQPAMSKRIRRLAEQGLIEIRRGPHGAKLVNLGDYADARERTKSPDGDLTLLGAKARRAYYQAELARLDVERRREHLLPADEVRECFRLFGEKTVRAIERVIGFSDEIATAVGKDGAEGARVILKRISHDSRIEFVAGIEQIEG